jgi:SAM-dependent methyltransferase
MTSDRNPDITTLRGPVALSHLFIRRFTREGDRVVDATCGNGNDTLLLAELVGCGGRVWAFDIQAQAINQTSARLSEAGLNDRVEIVPGGHETMTAHVSGPVDLIVFNLGYLPGGRRDLITRPETTRPALIQSLGIIKPGGILLVTVYPGHDGAADEQQVLEAWAAGLDPRAYHSWRMGQTNVAPTAPYLMLVQRAA